MANENGLEVILRANIKQLEKDLKGAEDELKDFKKKSEGGAEGFENISESLDKIKGSGAFSFINEATGGIAGKALDIVQGFKGATAGVQGFKAALVSTGIGALVVAVGALVVYWDDISDFIKGANRELQRQREIQQEVVDTAQYQIDLINAQIDSLKLAGKTDKEINKLKRERLTTMLREKSALLEIAKTQLENTIKSEEATKEALRNFTALGLVSAHSLAKSFDSIFGTNFAKDIIAAGQAFEDFVAGTDSEEARKEVDDLRLELVKLQNTIDKTKLNDIKIDKKSAEDAKKEAEKYKKFLESIDTDLEFFDQEKLRDETEDINKIFQHAQERIEDFSNIKVGDYGFGDGTEAVSLFEAQLKKVRDLLNDEDFNFDQILTTEQIDNFTKKLENSAKEAAFTNELVSNAISEVGGTLANSLKTDNAIFDSFASTIISTGEKMLQDLIAQSLAGTAAKAASASAQIPIDQATATSAAVSGAATTAAASGPGAAFLLPLLIGAAIGFVGSAFSGIKFANGGFVPGGSYSGDRVPALLNSGEAVINTGQQKRFMDIANGMQVGTGEASVLELKGVLRGSNILLSYDRSIKKRKRFNR